MASATSLASRDLAWHPAAVSREISPTYRMFGIFRFGLALLVVAQHFAANIGSPRVFDAVVPLAPGNCAVLVFFVLSGFIIAEAAACYYPGRPLAFLLNRGLRLVPPFVVALAAVILAHLAVQRLVHPFDPQIFSPASIVWNLLSIFPGARSGGDLLGGEPFSFIPAVWALRAEFCFYVLFAVCLAAIALSGRSRPVLAAGGVIGMAAFAAQQAGLAPALFELAPYFVLGVSLYYAVSGSRLAVLMAGVAAIGVALQFPTNDTGPASPLYDRTAQAGLLVGLIALLVLLSFLKAPRVTPLRKIDQRLGDLSYAIYLNHAAVQVAFTYYGGRTDLELLAAVGLTLVYAALMLQITEPPLRWLRDRVRRHKL